MEGISLHKKMAYFLLWADFTLKLSLWFKTRICICSTLQKTVLRQKLLLTIAYWTENWIDLSTRSPLSVSFPLHPLKQNNTSLPPWSFHSRLGQTYTTWQSTRFPGANLQFNYTDRKDSEKTGVSVAIKIIKSNPYEQNIELFSKDWGGMALGLYQTNFESAPSLTLLIAYRICFFKKSEMKKSIWAPCEEKALGL